MKRIALILLAGMTLLLTGCATTVRSDVTTFHKWPAALQDKSYVFEAPPAQDDTLEWRSYQNLVRAELGRLGFTESAAGANPSMAVSMRFMTTDIPVRVVRVAYPAYYSMQFGYYHPYRRGYWGGWYSPFWYDPFWYGVPQYEESIEHNYRRELQVSIKALPSNERLWDTTVRNLSREMSTPKIMPALVHSAFEGFPGPAGGSRVVTLKQERQR